MSDSSLSEEAFLDADQFLEDHVERLPSDEVIAEEGIWTYGDILIEENSFPGMIQACLLYTSFALQTANSTLLTPLLSSKTSANALKVYSGAALLTSIPTNTGALKSPVAVAAVSYTHLDVYKRQSYGRGATTAL